MRAASFRDAVLVAMLIAAADTRAARAWAVRVDVQMVAVTPAKALVLVPQLASEESVDAASRELQQLIARDEAELLGWPVVVTSADGRGGAETVGEVRHPTELSPPQGIHQPLPPQPPPQLFKWYPWQLFPKWGTDTPVEWETRSAGPMVEVECAVDDDARRIAVNATAEFVWLLGFRNIQGVKSPAGTEPGTIQPQFTRAKLVTSMTAQNGQRMLIGTFVEHEPRPRILLFLLRAVATPAGTR